MTAVSLEIVEMLVLLTGLVLEHQVMIAKKIQKLLDVTTCTVNAVSMCASGPRD